MNLRHQARWIRPIAAIMALALVCGAYILNKQRLDNPFAERYTLHLQFDAVDAVTPGLGSPITVAGVAVGQIEQARLENGRGVLRASIDPGELPRVYADATAALIPNTPLEDMQIRLAPGKRTSDPLPDGATIPIRATTTPIDADELLRSLDADTRAWVQTLIADLGTGLEGRSRDLKSVLRTLGPTAAQTRRISGLLAQRRRAIGELVGDLRTITEATARSDGELRQVVEAGDATLAALAVNDQPLRRSLELLPGTLRAARRTLGNVQPLAASLDSALARIDPSLQALPATLRESPDALRGIVPLPIDEFSQFVEAVGPLGRHVRPAARDLAVATPLLERSFGVLGRATDMLAYQAGDSESYLFWLAWFFHNATSTLSTEDAHGAVFRGYALFSCSSFDQEQLADLLVTMFGFAGTCPPAEGGGR